MALHPACHAVEDYLAAWFPRSIIEEFEWAELRCWAFRVTVPTLTFQLLVSTQFLDETNDHDIGLLLDKWHVARQMRRAGADEWVLVTLDGTRIHTDKHRGRSGKNRSPLRDSTRIRTTAAHPRDNR